MDRHSPSNLSGDKINVDQFERYRLHLLQKPLGSFRRNGRPFCCLSADIWHSLKQSIRSDLLGDANNRNGSAMNYNKWYIPPFLFLHLNVHIMMPVGRFEYISKVCKTFDIGMHIFHQSTTKSKQVPENAGKLGSPCRSSCRRVDYGSASLAAINTEHRYLMKISEHHAEADFISLQPV